MDLKTEFETAVAQSKLLPSKPSNEILLQLYSLYKQSTTGDVTGEPPSNPFDIVNRAKFESWLTQKGKSPETAMQEYIDLVARLKG